jgi:Na+/proline symporter
MLPAIVIVLAISLTISSIDTLINAISSLVVVDGNKLLNFRIDYLKLSKYFIAVLSIIAFVVASRGLSILYLFLLADLFCCAAVLTVFYSFYDKKISEKNAYISIIIGLFVGLLLFPNPDYSKSILIGILLPISNFPIFMSQSLLFLSFLLATFVPILTWKIK